MDIWGYKYPCVWYSKAIPRKTKPRAFWKKGRRAGKRDLHPEEQSSAAKGRKRRIRGGARDCSSADQEGDPAESVLELGSIVIQRFESFVLWFGAVVLWCLRRSAQGLVNLLNSQVISKRSESSCSSLYCTCASGSSVVSRCNKSEHMKVDCPEGKKEKHINHKKEFHKKKNKAIVATWSDDESSDCNEESSTSDENEICFMVGSNEEQGVDTVPGSVDTRPSFQKTLFAQLGRCVDTLSGSVDTLRLKFQLMIFLDTWPLGDQWNLSRFLCPRTLRLLMDIWGYKYPCVWYSKAIPRKIKPKAFWKKGRRVGKRDLHPEEQSSAAKGRRRRKRGGARDCSSANQEGDPAESVLG
ncbi:hypothetical protein Taro_046456 [Colocasia esculenta]|uniref:Uncharacterized protein n=1 Tax=Colocasia esculenta TaxID=4460 RepID=A0A843WSG6_COLES|nr:hypothetical protein [Colocasia esculenta]